MGRYSYGGKTEADDLDSISTAWLKKYDYFCGFKFGGIEWTHGLFGNKSSVGFRVSVSDGDHYIRFQYTKTRQSGEKEEFDYKVGLATTPCNYGGVRYWFICPLARDGKPCGRRVGTLYMGGDYFGCRHCYDLTYDSKNENRRYKSYPLFATLFGYQKAEKLEAQIKRRYYNGKPTRKQRRLDRIYRQIWRNSQLIDKAKGL